jgi:hypothetical protein
MDLARHTQSFLQKKFVKKNPSQRFVKDASQASFAVTEAGENQCQWCERA